MLLSTLKPVACGIPPAIGATVSNSKVSKVAMMNRQPLPPLQVKEKEKLLVVTSRREMMQLTAASVGSLSLLLPASAEAHPTNATTRQKIMEIFEELMQKAGLSKPKEESEEESKLKVDNEETKPKMKIGERYVPALPNIINGKTVETTLP